MTAESLFTLSDECVDLLNNYEIVKKVDDINKERQAYNAENGYNESDAGYKENLWIYINFCDVEDNIEAEATQFYVLGIARELQQAFPKTIKLNFINIWENPTAVDKFKTSTLTSIYSTDVIVEFGTEYRIYSLSQLYVIGEDDKPWAFNAEKRLASAILAVTKSETPVACVTINHGENLKDYELLYQLQDAGYTINSIDLIRQDIPEDCDLLVTYNPISDFLNDDDVEEGVTDISEIAKLVEYLSSDEGNSYMVFLSPDAPALPHLEEYLSEYWGIEFQRNTTAQGNTYSYKVKDAEQSLSSDGMTVVGQYSTVGAGADLTADMRKVAYPSKVIFKNAMPIKYSFDTIYYDDENDDSKNHWYGFKYNNGIARSVYDIFTSTGNAVAMANGVEVAKATELEPFKLMTLSIQLRNEQEDSYGYDFASNNSYVLACGSVDFAAKSFIQSSTYGNSELLNSALQIMGKDSIAITLKFVPFADSTIDSLTTAEANQYTVVLTTVPSVIILAVGIFVLVRRKYS
jgi:hypothetical protein